jgi:hypothetical protein
VIHHKNIPLSKLDPPRDLGRSPLPREPVADARGQVRFLAVWGGNDLLKPISWRVQLGLVASGYAAVFVVSAALVFSRYLMERNHAADVSAASGMYAAGDLFLGIFIACLFMIPTFFLAWVMAKFETVYIAYSQLLLGISLSAPVCLGLLVLGKNHVPESLIAVCLCRLVSSPFVLVGIGVSRFLARFGRAKRLTLYALLIEGLTLISSVVLFLRH